MCGGKNIFEHKKGRHDTLQKTDVRKRLINEATDEMENQIGFKCDICDQLCLTRAGLKGHQKAY